MIVTLIPSAAITRAMVDQDKKRIEDFEGATARANSLLLQTLQPKDIMATIMLSSVAERWEKVATNYADVFPLKTLNARSNFYNFKMRGGDTVLQTQHCFNWLVNECAIQVIVVLEEVKTLVLLTHPTEIWRTFMDAYATQIFAPTVSIILKSMKAQEEIWNSRNERAYGEANYVGRGGRDSGGGGGSNGGFKSEVPAFPKPISGSDQRARYCCEKTGHFARECLMCEKACKISKTKGHHSNMC